MVYIPERGRLKLASYKATSDANGKVVLDFKIVESARLLEGGEGWFNAPRHPDDKITKLCLIDVDGVAYPAGTPLVHFHDDSVAIANQGWYIPPEGKLVIPTIENPETAPGGFYIRVEAQTGDNRQDDFYINVKWGDPTEG